jgi:hypothetical protein
MELQKELIPPGWPKDSEKNGNDWTARFIQTHFRPPDSMGKTQPVRESGPQLPEATPISKPAPPEQQCKVNHSWSRALAKQPLEPDPPLSEKEEKSADDIKADVRAWGKGQSVLIRRPDGDMHWSTPNDADWAERAQAAESLEMQIKCLSSDELERLLPRINEGLDGVGLGFDSETHDVVIASKRGEKCFGFYSKVTTLQKETNLSCLAF